MKRTILDQMGIDSAGNVAIRLQKQYVDSDSGEIIASEPHRFVVGIDDDPVAIIESVSGHLASLGYPVVPAETGTAIAAMRTAAA